MTITYITGGIRSGKSEFAEKLAALSSGTVLYVAFGVITDDEMRCRIAKHQERRPKDWGVLEMTDALYGNLSDYQTYDTVLVDCISTWIANKAMKIPESELKDESHKNSIINEAAEWLESIRGTGQQFIIVSNESGLGGVALSPLGRFFQDVLGKVNQLMAASADEAYAVLSGLPVRLK